MLLRRHNLNLLPILRELLRTRSVSRTAEIVGLSQSAVSAALARLRETYNDDLLVMVGRRLELTEKGAQLIEPTERACLEVEGLLRPSQFDPSTESRRFVVATADYVTFLLGPALTQMFAERAPNASVYFVDVPSDLQAQILRGAIDVVAVPADTAVDAEVDLRQGERGYFLQARLNVALPGLDRACGLETGRLLAGDVVVDPLVPIDGALAVRDVAPDPTLLARHRADADLTRWWLDRLERTRRIVEEQE